MGQLVQMLALVESSGYRRGKDFELERSLPRTNHVRLLFALENADDDSRKNAEALPKAGTIRAVYALFSKNNEIIFFSLICCTGVLRGAPIHLPS